MFKTHRQLRHKLTLLLKKTQGTRLRKTATKIPEQRCEGTT